MENSIGGFMIQNELTLLEIMVGLGFLGWIMLMFVQVVWMNKNSKSINPSQRDLKKGYEKTPFLKAV